MDNAAHPLHNIVIKPQSLLRQRGFSALLQQRMSQEIIPTMIMQSDFFLMTTEKWLITVFVSSCCTINVLFEIDKIFISIQFNLYKIEHSSCAYFLFRSYCFIWWKIHIYISASINGKEIAFTFCFYVFVDQSKCFCKLHSRIHSYKTS